jgi:hypothetical protein
MAAVASWLPFVRATAIGWVPIAKNPIPPAHVHTDRLHSDEKVGTGFGIFENICDFFFNVDNSGFGRDL